MESTKQGKPTAWLGGSKGFRNLEGEPKNGPNLLWGLVCMMLGAGAASLVFFGVRHASKPSSAQGAVNINMSWEAGLPGGGKPEDCSGVDNLVNFLEVQETDTTDIEAVCEDMSDYTALFGREMLGCNDNHVAVFWELFEEACAEVVETEEQDEAARLLDSLLECDDGCVWASPMGSDTMCKTMNSIEYLDQCEDCISDLLLQWQQTCLVPEADVEEMLTDGVDECPGVIMTDWEETEDEYIWELTPIVCSDCEDDDDPDCIFPDDDDDDARRRRRHRHHARRGRGRGRRHRRHRGRRG